MKAHRNFWIRNTEENQRKSKKFQKTYNFWKLSQHLDYLIYLNFFNIITGKQFYICIKELLQSGENNHSLLLNVWDNFILNFSSAFPYFLIINDINLLLLLLSLLHRTVEIFKMVVFVYFFDCVCRFFFYYDTFIF